jgi:hypothetical protein
MAALRAACIDAAIFSACRWEEMKSFSLMLSCQERPVSVAESRRGSIVLVETLTAPEAIPLYLPQGLSAFVKFDLEAEHLG